MPAASARPDQNPKEISAVTSVFQYFSRGRIRTEIRDFGGLGVASPFVRLPPTSASGDPRPAPRPRARARPGGGRLVGLASSQRHTRRGAGPEALRSSPKHVAARTFGGQRKTGHFFRCCKPQATYHDDGATEGSLLYLFKNPVGLLRKTQAALHWGFCGASMCFCFKIGHALKHTSPRTAPYSQREDDQYLIELSNSIGAIASTAAAPTTGRRPREGGRGVV